MVNLIEKWKNRVKGNWEKTRQDPYVSVKMNYRAVKYMIIIVSGLIVVNIVSAIIKMDGSSAMSLLVRAAMVLVGIFIIQRMYFGVLNPLKKTLDHYELNPNTQTSKKLNIEQEIDDIFAKFDKKKNERIEIY